jgi:hypothetical protein
VTEEDLSAALLLQKVKTSKMHAYLAALYTRFIEPKMKSSE